MTEVLDPRALNRALLTGGVELHCPLGELPRLLGPLTGPDLHLLPPHTTVVGARFWPGRRLVSELREFNNPADHQLAGSHLRGALPGVRPCADVITTPRSNALRP